MAPLRVLLFWSCTVSLSACSPFSTLRSHNSLVARQTASCQNPQAALDSSCWDTLNISNYLNGPATGWVHNTPTCTTGQDDSACCQSSEAWSTCFLRLATATGGQDCTQISGGVCQYTGQFDPNLSPSIKAQVQYVALTIYRMNELFLNMYGGAYSIYKELGCYLKPLI